MRDSIAAAALAAVLGGWLAVGVALAEEPPARALIKSRCTRCHTLKRVEFMVGVKNRAAWQKTVSHMVAKGARLNQAEMKAVVDYLSGLEKGDKL